MSEEKPTFKVTDRRLFNVDGTPREGVREELETAETSAPSTTDDNPALDVSAAPQVETGSGSGEATSGVGAPPVFGASETGAAAEERNVGAEASGGEGDDPQEFLMVVEFVASFAADALGMSAHPMAGAPSQVNLPLAKQCIDMLGTLEKKTRGNLNAEERHVFELILSQLRMQYVSLSGAGGGGAARGSRGFSGSDITGGR